TKHGGAAADTIKCIAIADQNSKRAFRGRSRNADGNAANDRFSAIRPNDRLDGDLVSRTSLSDVGARALQPRPAAVTHNFKIKLHGTNVGDVIGIVVDAAEAISQ